jgi:AhpD family alkylhydroperoxidase
MPDHHATPLVPLAPENHPNPEVQSVFDDIRKTRNTTWINNFWRVLAGHPATLRRMWESVKQVMAPGALDPLTKEMLYVAVSVTNNCEYCIHSHLAAARAKGMTEAQFHELMAVVSLANETNRLANGYRIPVDEAFRQGFTAGPTPAR